MGAPAIDLRRLKMHLRVDGDFEDSYILGLMNAAVDYCELYTGRILQSRSLEVRLDRFPPDVLHLSVFPVASVESISYVNTSGDLVVLDPESYRVITSVEPAVILPTTPWPSDILPVEGSVALSVTAGYESLPKGIEQAVLVLCGHFYENREIMRERYARGSEMPFSVTALLHPYKVWRW